LFNATSAPPDPRPAGSSLAPASVRSSTPARFAPSSSTSVHRPAGDGEYVITRIISSHDAVYNLEIFISGAINPNGETFTFTVPTPSTAAPLAAAGSLAHCRRRR